MPLWGIFHTDTQDAEDLISILVNNSFNNINESSDTIIFKSNQINSLPQEPYKIAYIFFDLTKRKDFAKIIQQIQQKEVRTNMFQKALLVGLCSENQQKITNDECEKIGNKFGIKYCFINKNDQQTIEHLKQQSLALFKLQNSELLSSQQIKEITEESDNPFNQFIEQNELFLQTQPSNLSQMQNNENQESQIQKIVKFSSLVDHIADQQKVIMPSSSNLNFDTNQHEIEGIHKISKLHTLQKSENINSILENKNDEVFAQQQMQILQQQNILQKDQNNQFSNQLAQFQQQQTQQNQYLFENQQTNQKQEQFKSNNDISTTKQQSPASSKLQQNMMISTSNNQLNNSQKLNSTQQQTKQNQFQLTINDIPLTKPAFINFNKTQLNDYSASPGQYLVETQIMRSSDFFKQSVQPTSQNIGPLTNNFNYHHNTPLMIKIKLLLNNQVKSGFITCRINDNIEQLVDDFCYQYDITNQNVIQQLNTMIQEKMEQFGYYNKSYNQQNFSLATQRKPIGCLGQVRFNFGLKNQVYNVVAGEEETLVDQVCSDFSLDKQMYSDWVLKRISIFKIMDK